MLSNLDSRGAALFNRSINETIVFSPPALRLTSHPTRPQFLRLYFMGGRNDAWGLCSGRLVRLWLQNYDYDGRAPCLGRHLFDLLGRALKAGR